MAKKRGDVQMFDRGGDIETLKKRCKKETGLEPPRQPEFQAWALKAMGNAAKAAKAAPKSGVKMKRAARKTA